MTFNKVNFILLLQYAFRIELFSCSLCLVWYVGASNILLTTFQTRQRSQLKSSIRKAYCKSEIKCTLLKVSVGVLEYSTRTRVQLEYHFLSTRTRNPRYSVGTRTRRSMYSVLGQKKSRVHEYIWSLLKVINKMNF